MSSESLLVRVEGLAKQYAAHRNFAQAILRKPTELVRAVDGIDLQIERGEVLGLSGMSGCGKTTTGKILAQLETATSGRMWFKDEEITNLRGASLKNYRKKTQMIFQDPYQSLDPRYNVHRTLVEPLNIHHIGDSKKDRLELVCDSLKHVGLTPPEEFLARLPHELSGGQRQRIVIARAIILHPEFIVADEPVSMLDVSVRIGVLNLMLRLKEELDITYLFVSHDLAVIRYICNRVAIMYLGKIVETGAVGRVVSDPLHPYTQVLLSSVPVPDPTYNRKALKIEGDPSSSVDIPRGCRFHPRCPYAMPICREKTPNLANVDKDRAVACFLATSS